jgi:hypothetical protein
MKSQEQYFNESMDAENAMSHILYEYELFRYHGKVDDEKVDDVIKDFELRKKFHIARLDAIAALNKWRVACGIYDNHKPNDSRTKPWLPIR